MKLLTLSIMKKNIQILSILFVFTLVSAVHVRADTGYWEVQSIDTMKFSRDLARERLNDPTFSAVIENQMRNISETGATHVAIGTPYDEEFLPFLGKWVDGIRKYDMNVWFRGNFSGWEGWFDYESISKEDHIRKVSEFIRNNDKLFRNGDIFTSCTECENGTIGDPRRTGDVEGFRNYLIREYKVSSEAFKAINKKVSNNYFSMNGDVAKLVMDKDTTKKLDGIVVIDHYVGDPEQLSKDVRNIAESSGGRVILGEFGVPIPDIHGHLSEEKQAEWLDEALGRLAYEGDLAGLNYWVAYGGTTALWNLDSNGRKASEILGDYYTPEKLTAVVKNEFGRAINKAKIQAGVKYVETYKEGNFEVLIVPSVKEVRINAKGYEELTLSLDEVGGEIVLEKSSKGLMS